MGNLGKKLQKRSQEKLKEDNLKYVAWIRDLVNIVYNSQIAVQQLEAALNAKPGEETLLEMGRVDELKSVYSEVLEFFQPEEDDQKEEKSNG